MDLQKLAGTLLSSDSINSLSTSSGASKSQVKKVLTAVLPSLLSGADQQASGADTASGFAAALASHAKNSTLDISSFFDGIDLADGAKIIGHLLGSDTESVTESVAEDTGVSVSKVGSIMSAAAPLLMSLLGQQAEEDEDKDSSIGSLVGTLLSNVDVGELLTGLLTDDDDEKTTAKKSTSTKKKTSTAKKSTSTKKKSASSKKSSDSVDVGSIVGSLLGKLLK